MDRRAQITILVLSLLSCRHLASTMFLSRMPSNALGSELFCDNIPGLSVDQRNLCQQHPDSMTSIGFGVQLAADECHHQFRHHRWNCSTVYSTQDSVLFNNFMVTANREVAFVYTITSAAVTYTVAQACSDGTLSDCACDASETSGSSSDSSGKFDWTGCSDNIDFGVKLARQFIDAKESNSRDVKALMNLHNNSAGRRGVRKHVKLKCKCHGVSGSCNMRTCWKAMQNFAFVGDYLKKKYDRAKMVVMDQKTRGLISTMKARKHLRKSDIVYMERSSDYCQYDVNQGSAGTGGRVCNNTSSGPDGCDSMCCGRGFRTRTVKETVNCACKFQWCCFVKCKSCNISKQENTCLM